MTKRKEFCCDANKDFYEQYYANQSGSGIPVFYGALGQRGHGLGSMISDFSDALSHLYPVAQKRSGNKL